MSTDIADGDAELTIKVKEYSINKLEFIKEWTGQSAQSDEDVIALMVHEVIKELFKKMIKGDA